MPPAVQRVRVVKELFEEDIAGLKAYEAPLLPCPLKFQLVSSATELTDAEIQACIELVEETSGDDYRASRIGWNTRKKREEMMDREMIYLLVRQDNTDPVSGDQYQEGEDACTETKSAGGQKSISLKGIPRHTSPARVPQQPQLNDLEQLAHGYAFDNDETSTPSTSDPASARHATNNRILGFISFMFTWDDPPHDDRDVVYIYEIHLASQLRGQGLGSRLMAFVEHAARKCYISKTMLTVFTANEGAKAMYEKLGYERDECSPADRVMRNKVVKAEYVIMSKNV